MADSQIFQFVTASIAKWLNEATACTTTGTAVNAYYKVNAFDPEYRPGAASASAYFMIDCIDRGIMNTIANTGSGASKFWVREPQYYIYACSYFKETDPYFAQLLSMGNIIENAFGNLHGFPLYEFSTPSAPTDTGQRIRVLSIVPNTSQPTEVEKDSRLFNLSWGLRVKYHRLIG